MDTFAPTNTYIIVPRGRKADSVIAVADLELFNDRRTKKTFSKLISIFS